MVRSFWRTNRSARPSRAFLLLLTALLTGVVSPPAARAATSWTVCGALCDFPTIAAALASGSVVSGDTLRLTAANYPENNLNVTKSLTFLGVGSPAPTIGATGNTIFHVSGNIRVSMQNLTIQNGVTGTAGQGAGINVATSNAHLTLDQVTVRNNRVVFPAGTGLGGGINTLGPLTVTNSMIFSNTVTTGTSGQIGQSAFGGGIRSNGASLFISNTQIISNVVQGGASASDQLAPGGSALGGGVYYTNDGGLVTIINSTATSNTVRGGVAGGRSGTAGGTAKGAGLAVNAIGVSATARVLMDRVYVQWNRAEAGDGQAGTNTAEAGSDGGAVFGGGVWLSFNTALTMTQSLVAHNTALGGQAGPGGPSNGFGGAGGDASGGGMTLEGSALLSATQILSNTAVAGIGGAANGTSSGGAGGIAQGGGLYTGPGTQVIDSAIVSNTLRAGGGGAGLLSGSPFQGVGGAAGSANGGGIASFGTLSVTNSTVGLNTAIGGAGGAGGQGNGGSNPGQDGSAGGAAAGGGIYLGSGQASVRSATIVSNTALGGQGGAGGLGSGFGGAGQTGVTGPGEGGGLKINVLASVMASIIAKNAAAAGTDVSGVPTSLGGNIVGVTVGGFSSPNDKTGVDPLVQKIADNGGATLTAALTPASPAIGFAGGRACPALDQRGQPRRVGFCDSGAFAVQPNLLQLVAGSGQSTLVGTAFAAPLQARPLYGTTVLTGAAVTFTAPGSGPSVLFGGSPTTVVTAATGIASALPTANLIGGGQYVATASSGTATPIAFGLTNLFRTTSTTVGTAPSPSAAGAQVTVSASVSASGGSPTGNIAISVDTGENCVITAPGGSCVLVFGAPGDRTVTATYAGDSQHSGSSASAAHSVTAVAGGGGSGKLVFIGLAAKEAVYP